MKVIILTSLIGFICSFQVVYAQKSTIETIGDISLITIPVATLSTTFLKKDRKGTWQFTKGFIFNQAITFGLKQAINKPRPLGQDNNSFPSGHTSTTFQGASFIHQRYGFKYSIPAYALAGFTAFSRIDAQKHDGWDILAGAAIGIGSTLLFTTPYQKEHLELSFNSYNHNYLVGFKFTY